MPKVERPKYNHKDPFRWVDSQWEKFMKEQKELKAHIKQLQEDLVTCNNHFQKQRKNLLKLELENAEMRDKLINSGNEI